VDHRADIYALGLTLLFLLTGKRPFDGNTPFSIVLAHANKPLPRGNELGTDLPEEVETLVGRMAAKEPIARYANYDLLLEDLRRVKAGYAPTFKLLPGTRKTLPRKLVWTAAAIALALGVVATAVWVRREKATLSKQNSGPPAEITQRSETFVDRESENRFRDPPDDPGPPPRDGDFEERQGPPGRGREGRFPFPLPRLPWPNFNALSEGPVEKMLAEADDYALKNPQNFRDIIDRYRQVLSAASGTPQADLLDRKTDNVVSRHQAAVRQAMSRYESKMQEKLRAGKPQEAYDAWKDFPANLRTRESDQEIQQALDRALPAGFVPR